MPALPVHRRLKSSVNTSFFVVRDTLTAPLDVTRQKGVATEKRPRWTRPLDGKYKTGRDVAVRPAPLVPEKPRERRKEDESVQLVLGLHLGLGIRTGHLEGLLAG